MPYCIYAVIIWIKILTWYRAPKSRGHKKIIPRFAISMGICKPMHKQIIYLKIPTRKHKQAKKRAALHVQKHCAWLSRVGIEPMTSHSRCKKEGIRRLAWISSTRCDGFTWWPKTYVFECQPPNWGWVGYELIINLVYPIAIATIYRCNCSDPNNHCIAIPLQRPALSNPQRSTHIGRSNKKSFNHMQHWRSLVRAYRHHFCYCCVVFVAR